jgi:hypothetical protein
MMCIFAPSRAAPAPRSDVLHARMRAREDLPVVQEQERGDAGQAAVQHLQPAH